MGYFRKGSQSPLKKVVIEMKAAILLAILAVAYTLDNGLALTPPMVCIFELL